MAPRNAPYNRITCYSVRLGLELFFIREFSMIILSRTTRTSENTNGPLKLALYHSKQGIFYYIIKKKRFEMSQSPDVNEEKVRMYLSELNLDQYEVLVSMDVDN